MILDIDVSKVRILVFDSNFEVRILKIERIDDDMDMFFSITYSWGDFSVTEVVHIDDTNIKQLIIEGILNE